MKVIKYNLFQSMKRDGTPNLAPVTMHYSEESLAIAKAEAYKGEYTIEDDGQPEPEAQPTEAERIAELEEALALLLSGVTE